MPDQEGGSFNTESLANEQSSNRARSGWKGHSPTDSGGAWRNKMLQWFRSRSPSPAPPPIWGRRPPVQKENVPNTLWGSANPYLQGGMVRSAAFKPAPGTKPDKTLGEKMREEATTEGPVTQPIANPGGSQHNQTKRLSGPFSTPKEASMETKSEQRIDQVRALLKFAACMRKSKKKKMKKRSEAATPDVSIAAPATAATLGAGATGLSSLLSRTGAKALLEVGPKNPLPPEVGAQLKKFLKVPKWKMYGLLPALSGISAGAPVLAGAMSAKQEGGAGRGAAAGAITGASISTLAKVLGALKTKNMLSATGTLGALLGGAGFGAAGGAIGGAVQKRRRRKAQEKGKKTEEKQETEEKKAALRKVAFSAKKMRKVAKLPWGKLLGYGSLGLGALGLGTVAPPIFRGLRHDIEMAWNPAYRRQQEWQKMMYSPQMMMFNMMRGMRRPESGGFGGPALSADDRKMFQHASYLRGLRAKVRALNEAFGA